MSLENLEFKAEWCDGVNPITGEPCMLRWHRGFHLDGQGVRWLDD